MMPAKLNNCLPWKKCDIGKIVGKEEIGQRFFSIE